MNWLFPAVGDRALTFAVACWLERLWAAESAAASVVGFALLAALTALATLEHWLMVLPLPDEKLWRWAMSALRPNPKPRQD
jgi:putative photosynthetic complex assembly protein 2